MPAPLDPLDRISNLERVFANGSPIPFVILAAAEMDALVEVARAARDLTFELDDAIKAAVNEDWSQDDYDRWDAARARGEAALARLDKEQP